MKQTLRDRIELMLKRLEDRCTQLDEHIIKYAEVGNHSDAAINQIKKESFQMVVSDLRRQLQSS